MDCGRAVGQLAVHDVGSWSLASDGWWMDGFEWRRVVAGDVRQEGTVVKFPLLSQPRRTAHRCSLFDRQQATSCCFFLLQS